MHVTDDLVAETIARIPLLEFRDMAACARCARLNVVLGNDATAG